MLEIEDLQVRYGGIRALKGVSLGIEEKRIVTLLGTNGAGKSTTIRAVSGIVPIESGVIRFLGRPVNKMAAHDIQRLGLVHSPEGRKIFANLSVKENLIMGGYNNRDRDSLARVVERVFSIFPILPARIKQLGGTLSGGEQQMLALARALMSRPKLLMMDEPSLGLAPLIVADVFTVIQDIRNEGVTILLVEQNAGAALKIADYAFVMESGRIALKGTGAELANDQRVRQAYLGERIESPSLGENPIGATKDPIPSLRA